MIFLTFRQTSHRSSSGSGRKTSENPESQPIQNVHATKQPESPPDPYYNVHTPTLHSKLHSEPFPKRLTHENVTSTPVSAHNLIPNPALMGPPASLSNMDDSMSSSSRSIREKYRDRSRSRSRDRKRKHRRRSRSRSDSRSHSKSKRHRRSRTRSRSRSRHRSSRRKRSRSRRSESSTSHSSMSHESTDRYFFEV